MIYCVFNNFSSKDRIPVSKKRYISFYCLPRALQTMSPYNDVALQRLTQSMAAFDVSCMYISRTQLTVLRDRGEGGASPTTFLKIIVTCTEKK